MKPRIENSPEKKLIGKRITMAFSDNTTGELWKSFMPRRKEIVNNIGNDLYSMQLYGPQFFTSFNPDAAFEKWAAIEVTDFKTVPDGMETFILHGGLYAIFEYKGSANDASETFRYILGTWLPASEYELDERPHFEILGGKYKNNDPDSEEEIWIPIRKKV
ncbi:MAG TPA: GyrI-like domain-containing protein [Flavobacterium sp.]|nr:GyrI-like domain-containing protein [Flavobacterium sp.]